MHRRRVSSQRNCGSTSSAAYIIGRPVKTVYFSALMEARTSSGTKPRSSTTQPPAACTAAARQCCAQWNSGSTPENTSCSVIARPAMLPISAVATEICECTAPLGWPVVPLVYMMSAGAWPSMSMAGSSARWPCSAWVSVTAPAIALVVCMAMVTINGTPSLVSISATPGAA